MQGEIRQNMATSQWVMYDPSRSKPWQEGLHQYKTAVPVQDPACPFCPGNEQMLSAILMEMPGQVPARWQTRAVPNTFSTLTLAGKGQGGEQGVLLSMLNSRHGEVIIEHSCHNQQIATMTPAEVQTIIAAYHQRYIELLYAPDPRMVMLMHNHGDGAGTSLPHPHSQLIVTEVVPHFMESKEAVAQRYFATCGHCVYCDILAFEGDEQQRLVFENASFLAFVPFAAEVPYEMWILPKTHQTNFAAMTEAAQHDLAEALQHVLQRLYQALHDPDYTYIIHTTSRSQADEPHLHWYLQVQPRLTPAAHLVSNAGMMVNPSLPEADAVLLNEGCHTYAV